METVTLRALDVIINYINMSFVWICREFQSVGNLQEVRVQPSDNLYMIAWENNLEIVNNIEIRLKHKESIST